MYYECLGGNNYRITLKVYRDCFSFGPNVADFDDPAFIGVFSPQNGFDTLLYINLGNRVNVPPETSNPCYQAPANVCVEEGTYVFEINLPNAPGGYDIVYTRCCRNATIANINTPNQVGATYTLHIDPQANACNNSPVFKEFPPIVICAGQPLEFDHGATDPDGDILTYELCTPYVGGDQNDPQPLPLQGPFNQVVFRSPYSFNNPLGGNPILTIDPNTGFMDGTPTTQGQYVVGVCVKEFRNGVQIGEIRRDFQFNVTQCNTNVEARIPIIDTVGAGSTNTTGLYLLACEDFAVTFENQSINGSSWHWDFGVLGSSSDTSNVFEPTFTYPDTGIYIIRLIANPGYFCADTTTVYLRIYPGFKTAYITAPDCVDEPISFTDLSTAANGFVNSWQWDFGDGGTSQLQNPQHLYSAPGLYNVTLISTSSKGCRDTSTLQVRAYPEPEGPIDHSPACLNASMTFISGATVNFGFILGYQWDLGNGATSTLPFASTTYNTLGNYTVRVIVQSNFGCIDTTEEVINIIPPPVIAAFPDTIVCQQQPLQLLASGTLSYRWSPANVLNTDTIPNPIAVLNDSTVFTIVGTDINGCKDTTTLFVDVRDLPPTDAGRDTFVCAGSSYRLQGQGGVSFLWSPSSYMADSSQQAPIIVPDSSISYVLRSVSVDGCINFDTVNIEVQYPIVVSAVGDQSICRYESVQLSADGGKYYRWQPPTGLSNDTIFNPLASPDSTVSYVVTISNDCFSDSLPLTVTVNQLPEVVASPDDSIRRDDTTIISAEGAISYVWVPRGIYDSLGQMLEVSPFNTTDYVVIGTDINGCKNRDSVRVYVEVVNLLKIPNAFTPDKNGKNDLYRIAKYLNIATLLDFSIYNRWGEKVFHTTDIKEGWDGTYRGQAQEMGVYVWRIKALNRDGQIIEQQGNVTLLR
ncbi:MAG: PKD domain-containing protein [Chitinophagales bacterium]|nr:PKD domain-containing protein [Chitinophagales bacterium]